MAQVFGKAQTSKKTFSRTTNIQQLITAEPAKIWSLLTNASDMPRWNSTIVSLDGDIREGGKIKLKSQLDPKRTFTLKVKEVIPNQKLVWGDAMGKRTYILEPQGEKTLFSMTEKIGGPIFPIFANKIPSFDASFEKFVSDLKQEAEYQS
ncbi:SRPBCC domain-containing protein [Maribacter sp. 2210JD10-5]|uniref:SRPBCC domain-containing protein n=1 Tax=Maribacter sp. 2210JD10-5 TaxID=3386272 RepID=UPI0039BD3ECE